MRENIFQVKHTDHGSWVPMLVVSTGLLALVLVGLSWKWYQASVQRDVYERQGVSMTTWEVFIGVKPIERTINIKQPEKLQDGR